MFRTGEFSRGFGFLADPLNRAALSIAMNLAESNCRFTMPDRRHFFIIARGSTHECVRQLWQSSCANLNRNEIGRCCLRAQAGTPGIKRGLAQIMPATKPPDRQPARRVPLDHLPPELPPARSRWARHVSSVCVTVFESLQPKVSPHAR
jgi:hypothetical protein